MRKIRMLTKAILWNEEMERPSEQKKGKLYRVFGVMAMLCIIVPSCLIVGGISYLMTLALVEAGSSYEGFLFLLHFLSISAMIFGFQVVLSTFYFSSDMERLLPLPLRISEIIWMKFLKTYLAESAMEMIVLLSAMVGFFLAADISFVGVLAAIVGMFTLPLMPLLFCGIISVVVLYLTPWLKTRKQVSVFVWTFAIAMTMFAFWAMGGLSGLEVENFVAAMQDGSSLFMKSMGILFFQNELLARAMAFRNVGDLAVYVTVNCVTLGIFLMLSQKLYLKGYWRMNSVGENKGKLTVSQLQKSCKKRSVLYAYMRKEILILFRTGSYISNCVMMTYAWPAVIGIFLLWKGRGEVLMKYRLFYQRGLGGVDIMLLLLVLAIAVLTPGANAIAATSFTREGKHMDFMHFIPVSYGQQIKAKAWVSIIISYSSVLLSDLFIAKYFYMTIWGTLYILFVSFGAVVFICSLGIWLDGMHPRLIWEDETAAMRGNLNVFFNMAFAMVLGGGICILAYILYIPTDGGKILLQVFLLAFVSLLGYCGYQNAIAVTTRELSNK